MKTSTNSAASNMNNPLGPGAETHNAQEIVGALNEIWDTMVTSIRKDESSLNNQGGEPESNPVASTSGNQDTTQEKTNSKDNPNANDANTSKTKTKNSRGTNKKKKSRPVKAKKCPKIKRTKGWIKKEPRRKTSLRRIWDKEFIQLAKDMGILP